jgi:lactate dehydrogenase-like 2-hydroxyacid dehydrogenase
VNAKTKILVTRRTFPEAAEKLLRESVVTFLDGKKPPSHDELQEYIRTVDGLYAHITDNVTASVMDQAPKLKVIAEFGVGYDNIDTAAASERGIAVANTPGVLSETTADHAFGLMLAASRRLAESDRFVRSGAWGAFDPLALLGTDVNHATLGIIGLGRIGSEVARRAAGFDMELLYHNRKPAPNKFGAEYVDSLNTLLERSDFVSVHCPLTPDTQHLINAASLGHMKPTGILINTSRGPVVNHDDLYDALSTGTIAAAALDVTDPEPMDSRHPLLSLENCLVVPHVASATFRTRMKMAMMTVDNILAALNGAFPPHCVNQIEIEGRSRIEHSQE